MAKKSRRQKLIEFAIKNGRAGNWTGDQVEAAMANAETDIEVKKHLQGKPIEYFCWQLKHVWGLNGQEEFLALINLNGRN